MRWKSIVFSVAAEYIYLHFLERKKCLLLLLLFFKAKVAEKRCGVHGRRQPRSRCECQWTEANFGWNILPGNSLRSLRRWEYPMALPLAHPLIETRSGRTLQPRQWHQFFAANAAEMLLCESTLQWETNRVDNNLPFHRNPIRVNWLTWPKSADYCTT